MKNILVSMIVPVYNVEQYLPKCLDSIINQTYKNLEIILVNDGSIDSSPEICDNYAKLDSRIKVIHKENGGLSSARNKGLELCTGHYTTFIDSDDYVDLDYIEKVMIHSLEEDADVLVFGFINDFLDEHETILNSVKTQGLHGNYQAENFASIPLSYDNIGDLGYACNKVYKTNLIHANNAKFPKGISLVEDVMFNSLVLSKAKKISFINDSYYHYNHRPVDSLGSMMYDNYFELKILGLDAFTKILNSWKIENDFTTKIISQIGFDGLKGLIIELGKDESLTKSEKRKYLSEVLRQKEAIRILNNTNTISIKDKIIKFSMKYKRSQMLLKLYELR